VKGGTACNIVQVVEFAGFRGLSNTWAVAETLYRISDVLPPAAKGSKHDVGTFDQSD
jgi:hypothetical protein